MKKLLCLLMALLMVFALVACSDSDDDDDKKKKDKDNDVSVSEKEDTNDEDEDDDDSSVNLSGDATIEELVLVDESDVKITAKELSFDDYYVSIDVLIENNSSEDLTFSVDQSSVNDSMIYAYMSADVAAGKKANDSIEFYNEDLEFAGIDTIAKFDLIFDIYTTEDYDDYLTTDPVVLETSEADSYTAKVDESGEVAYDKDGIKIVIQGKTDKESYYGTGIKIYVENTTKKNVYVSSEDVSVNGFMVDPYFSVDVASGKHAYEAMTFSDDDLEDNNIEEIEDIELSFSVTDYESWDTIAETTVIKITF